MYFIAQHLRQSSVDTHASKEFKKRTGYGVVINTSFNVRGEPIVGSPENAYICFMRTNMDVLVLGNIVLHKTEMPEWHEKNNANDLAEEHGLNNLSSEPGRRRYCCFAGNVLIMCQGPPIIAP